MELRVLMWSSPSVWRRPSSDSLISGSASVGFSISRCLQVVHTIRLGMDDMEHGQESGQGKAGGRGRSGAEGGAQVGEVIDAHKSVLVQIAQRASINLQHALQKRQRSLVVAGV